MTNKQSDSSDAVVGVNETQNKVLIPDNECIKLEGERSKVQMDEKTIHDDIGDYFFIKAHKQKKIYKEVTDNPVDIENYPILKSTRSLHVKHKKKRMKRWKKILIGFVSVILALIIITVGSFAFLIYKGSQEMLDYDVTITAPDTVQIQNQGEYVVYNGKTYQLNENITNILFMGIDKRDLDEENAMGTGGQADVIVLMAVDTQTGKISMVNISRDIMTDVIVYSANGGYVKTEVQQLCLSYAYGDGKETSCENTVNSVRKLFYNIPINSYIALDLDGIATINDSIGGVDVVSPETVNDFVEGESYHLEGKYAEKFVRARNYSLVDSNNLRMERQQIYAEAFMQKVISQTKENISTPVDLFNASSPYTCTNLNPSKICYLAETAVTSNGMSVNMTSVPGEITLNGEHAEFYVDEDNFYEMFLNIFYIEMQ